MRVLVSHGADLNVHGGSDGWTPLFYAAMAGNSPLGCVHVPLLIVKVYQIAPPVSNRMLHVLFIESVVCIENNFGQLNVWCTVLVT